MTITTACIMEEGEQKYTAYALHVGSKGGNHNYPLEGIT